MTRTTNYVTCLILAFSFPLAAIAQQQSSSSTGTSTKGIYSLEMEIITPQQIEAYQRGEPPSNIVLKTGETLEDFLAPKTTPPTYELAWSAITCTGTVGHICGQPITGTSTGENYEITAGIVGDATLIFSDGFESGNTEAWD